MSQPLGERRFTLRAILMWTIHDLPAYGRIAGQTVKGYVACSICGARTCSEQSALLNKMIYMRVRRYLRPDHRYRRNRAAFNNSVEYLGYSEQRSGQHILQLGRERVAWLRAGGVEDSAPILREKSQHSICNPVLEGPSYLPSSRCNAYREECHRNLPKTMFGEKDNPEARLDMQQRCIRPHLWL